MYTSSKSKYLLQASLEILHEVSLEWLNEIAFMKEEVVFLSSLMTKNTRHHFPTVKSADLDKELASFDTDTLMVLHKKIMDHELWLADIIRTDTLSRQKFYREIHGELAEQMTTCHKQFIQLKQKIFFFVKNG